METKSKSLRSIGEVLALLRPDFPDISISKIRFLESQGLVTPERTPAGYRKFSQDDIARLRFVLLQQKENFLPLKVIKERLDAFDSREPDETDGQDKSSRSKAGVSASPGGMLSREDLLAAAELTESQLREVESFGLVQGERTGASIWYDKDVVEIAKLVGRFLAFGVEPRHLRIFKTSADREADLYKQLAGPVLNSRNTQARMEATARLHELTELGEKLRSELLQQSLNVQNL